MESLYTLFGELKADTSEFKSAMKSAHAQLHGVKGSIDEVEDRAQQLGKTTAVSARGFERMREAVASAEQKLKLTAEAFERGDATAEQMRAAMLNVERATSRLESKLNDAAASAEDFGARQAAAAEKAAKKAEAASERAAQKQEADVAKAANKYEKEQQRMAQAAEKESARASAAWKRSIDNMINGVQNAANGIKSIGTSLTIAITAPLALAGREILSSGADYEKALNVFEAVTSATADQMKRAADVAKQLGADITLPATSAADAANAMVELGKAGFTAAQSMDAAKGVLRLAAAAQIAEAQAAEIAANAINAFNLKASESTRVADLLAAAANASSAEITDIALAMQQASAVFAGAKIPIDDLTAAIGLMANAGIKGSDAGTSLKTFISRLTAPTDEAAKGLKQLGISAFDAQGNMLSLENILGQFEKKLAGLTDEAKAGVLYQIFGSDALRAAQILFREGTAGFEKMKAAVNQVGAAGDLATAKTKGLGGAWDAFKSQMETIGIQIFEAVQGPVTSLVRFLGEMAGRFSSFFGGLPTILQQVAVGFGVIVAAIGPLLVVVGAVAAGLATIASGVAAIGLPAIGIAIAAVVGAVIQLGPALAAATAAIYVFHRAWTENWAGIREKAASAMSFVYDTVLHYGGLAVQWWQQNWPAIQQVAQSVADSIVATVHAFVSTVEGFWAQHGQRIMEYVRAAWSFASAWISAAVNQIANVVQLGLAVIQGDWGQAWQKVLDITRHVWATLTTLTTKGINLVWNAIKAFGPIILQNAAKVMGLLIAAIGKGIGYALYIIATLPSQIIRLFPKFYAAGKDIASAIWQGIKEGLSGGLFGASIPVPTPEEVFPNGNPLQKLIDQFTKAFSSTSTDSSNAPSGPVNLLDSLTNSANTTSTSLDKVSTKLDDVKKKAEGTIPKISDATMRAAEKAGMAYEKAMKAKQANTVTAKMTVGSGKDAVDYTLTSYDTPLGSREYSAIDELVKIAAAVKNQTRYGEQYTGNYPGAGSDVQLPVDNSHSLRKREVEALEAIQSYIQDSEHIVHVIDESELSNTTRQSRPSDTSRRRRR